MLPKQTTYNVGIYLRLSRDDERAGESLSIENQRRVLTNYVKEQGWTIYDEYVDDGISGVTFDRPGVQRLLDDAKDGKINLILCKDLSRFGRNYIMVGQYLDYIFPCYNIRFIALNDNVDTANAQSSGMDMMPIMNVFNEWHAASTSKKVRAVIEAGAKAGKYKTTSAAYGYIKGDDEKCTPVVNPETAPIVERIFQMRASGYNITRICRVLNDEGIPSPSVYRYQKLGKTDPKYSHHLWSNNTIKSILHNPIYIGNLALLRRTTVSYKNHKVITKDESEWIIVEHNHEPIISQELWDKCREIDASVSHGKNTKNGVVKPLSGLCYCDTCGTKMKQTATSNSKIPVGYVCTLYGNFGKAHCTSHYITQKALESVVLADIRRQIDFVVNDEKAREKYLAKKRSAVNSKERTNQKRLQEVTSRIDELDGLIQSVYEDKFSGKIPEDVCIRLIEKYQAELKALQEEYEMLKESAKTEKQIEDDVEEFIRRLKSYAGAEELTRQMALDLIEYIIVDKNPNKRNEARNIHIYYKLLDKPLKNKSNALA